MRPCPLAPIVLSLSVLVALLSGCGQKGDLYLAEDDPARAERDARGRGKPFPFPAEDAEWPPDAPAERAAAAGSTPAVRP